MITPLDLMVTVQALVEFSGLLFFLGVIWMAFWS